MFSIPVGILDSNIAELRAIVKAIELSSSNCLLHHQHLIIESDSVNVISWMNKPHSRPWKHYNLFSSVNRLKPYFGSITFSHIFCESNCMADCMAKQGVRRSSEFVTLLWLHHFSVALLLCLLPLCLWVISVMFCRGMFSFELIRMDILWFSLLLFILVCAFSYIWLFAIVR